MEGFGREKTFSASRAEAAAGRASTMDRRAHMCAWLSHAANIVFCTRSLNLFCNVASPFCLLSNGDACVNMAIGAVVESDGALASGQVCAPRVASRSALG